jgi:hypothetical protein
MLYVRLRLVSQACFVAKTSAGDLILQGPGKGVFSIQPLKEHGTLFGASI